MQPQWVRSRSSPGPVFLSVRCSNPKADQRKGGLHATPISPLLLCPPPHTHTRISTQLFVLALSIPFSPSSLLCDPALHRHQLRQPIVKATTDWPRSKATRSEQRCPALTFWCPKTTRASSTLLGSMATTEQSLRTTTILSNPCIGSSLRLATPGPLTVARRWLGS
jgi:hypothetical protein